MVICDGAVASHTLTTRLDELGFRPGHQLIYSIGLDLFGRERCCEKTVWQLSSPIPRDGVSGQRSQCSI